MIWIMTVLRDCFFFFVETAGFFCGRASSLFYPARMVFVGNYSAIGITAVQNENDESEDKRQQRERKKKVNMWK